MEGGCPQPLNATFTNNSNISAKAELQAPAIERYVLCQLDQFVQ